LHASTSHSPCQYTVSTLALTVHQKVIFIQPETNSTPLKISASCRPMSRSLFLLTWFSLLTSFSSALRRLSASHASAFFLLFSSLSCLFLSACFFSLSSAFIFFSSSLSNLFSSLSVPLLALPSFLLFY